MKQPHFTLPFTPGQKRNLFIHNCTIIDPAEYKTIENASLIVKDGKIADFGANMQDPSTINKDEYEIIDATGLTLIPGLVDIQVHFRDPGVTHKEDIHSGSMSSVAGGVTTVVCQPNTSPVIDSSLVLGYLHYKEQTTSHCNIKTYAAITNNMKGEVLTDMIALAKDDMVVGFTDDGLPVMNSGLMRQAFEYSAHTGKIIAQHAEDLHLSNGGCMNEGDISTKLGVKGIPNISESVMVARDIEVMSIVPNSRYHVLHVSTKESLEHIRKAKIRGLKVTAEAAPHHFLLTDEAVERIGTNAKMNPPLRSEEDRAALVAAIKEGLIDAIATDHAPHDLLSKQKPLAEASFGIVGVETLLPLSLKLYHDKLINIHDLLAKLTYQPAQIIGTDRGVIAKGKVADLALVDLNESWTIDSSKFYSKSKNSPFDGTKVKGRVKATIVNGVVVYRG